MREPQELLLKLALCLLAAGARYRTFRAGERRRAGAALTILALAGFAAALTNFFTSHSGRIVHAQEMFHYGLGSKYSPELGYDGPRPVPARRSALRLPSRRGDLPLAAFRRHLGRRRSRRPASPRRALDHAVRGRLRRGPRRVLPRRGADRTRPTAWAEFARNIEKHNDTWALNTVGLELAVLYPPTVMLGRPDQWSLALDERYEASLDSVPGGDYLVRVPGARYGSPGGDA